MKLNRLFIIFIILGFQTSIFAQTTGTITGTVTDAKTGEPLIGATVILGELNWEMLPTPKAAIPSTTFPQKHTM